MNSPEGIYYAMLVQEYHTGTWHHAQSLSADIHSPHISPTHGFCFVGLDGSTKKHS